MDGQDPRDYYLFDPENNDYQGAPLRVSSAGPDSGSEPQDPNGDETCYRACLCGYTEAAREVAFQNIPKNTTSAPYQVCDCTEILGSYLFEKSIQPQTGTMHIYITPANITLLQYYGMIPCDAEVGKSGYFLEGNFWVVTRTRWVGVPDNDSMMIPGFGSDDGLPKNFSITDLVIKNDYECFGSFENISSVIFDYYRYSVEEDFLPPPPRGYCDPN